jgi:hypothetical protein
MADEEEAKPLDPQEMSDDQRKLIDLLGEDGVDEPAAAAPAPTTPARKPDASADEKKEETPAAETPAGTTTTTEQQKEPEAAPSPLDKRIDGISQALQKNQQDVLTILRKLEQKGTLTEKQQQQLESAKERSATLEDELAEIRTLAGRDPKDGDVYAETPKLAKTVLQQAERLKKLEDQLAVGTKVQSEQAGTSYWDSEAKAHPGVNVQDLWTKVCEEAEARPALKRAAEMVKASRLTPEEYRTMLQDEASPAYHDRVKAAKAPAPKPAAPPPPTPTQTAHRAPPKTPNGARVVDQGGHQPAVAMTAEEREQKLIDLLSEE